MDNSSKVKQKRISIWKNSILKNFIISYILVFLLPLGIIFTVFYHTGKNIVKNEVHNAKITIVNQFRRSMDGEINSMRAIVNYLNSNIELNSLLRLSETEFDANNRFDMTKITKDLSIYKSTDPFIDEMYVYIYMSDRCITSYNSKEAIYSFDDLHNVKYENIDCKKWKDIIHKNYLGDLISIPLNSPDYLTSNLYYMQSIPILPPKSSYATVVFRFNSEFIKDSMNIQALKNSTDIRIISKDSKVLISNKSSLMANLSYAMFDKNNGYIVLNKNIIYYVKSTVSSDVYVLVVPEESYIKEFKNMQTIFLLVFTICIILGGALTYFFTIRNYNPVKKLLAIIKQFSNNNNNNSDEYTQIRLALLDALDEKAQYEDQIKRNKEKQSENKLYKILSKKSLKENELKELLINEGIAFKNEYFCSVKVVLADYSDYFDYDSNVDDISQILFISKNIYKEMFEALYNIFMFTQEKSLLILINLNEQSQNQLNQIKSIALDAQKFLRDNYVVDSYASISNIYKNIDSINITFNEVEEAIQYFQLIGKGTIVVYKDFSNLSYTERLMKFMIKEENTLIGNIKSYNFESAKRTLNIIFEKYFFDEVKSPQLIRCRLFSLVNNIIDSLSTLEIPNKDKFIEDMNPYSKILNCSNAYEFQKQLNILLDEISKIFEISERNKDNELKEQILKIVEKNYKNPDLNVSFVADKVGKNLDYISRFFKKHTTIGLLDYIHHIRIDEAKRLLKENNYTIEKISLMVGYTSCDSFIRAFKRIEGMTPGKYRCQ